MKADGIKQRGLGAVALLVLAGVVWLLLFGTDPEPAVDTRSRIPPAPEQLPYEVAEPRVPSGVAPVDTPLVPEVEPVTEPPVAETPSAQPQTAAPVADSASTGTPVAEPVPHPEPATGEPGLDAHGLPEAWVVQVASLSHAGNAMQLRDRLREQGYKAYTETVRTAGGSATRVLVGPKLSRELAERDKAAIDQTLGLNSLVVRFDPNSGR